MKVTVWAYNHWALHQFHKHFGPKAARRAMADLLQARAMAARPRCGVSFGDLSRIPRTCDLPRGHDDFHSDSRA